MNRWFHTAEWRLAFALMSAIGLGFAFMALVAFLIGGMAAAWPGFMIAGLLVLTVPFCRLFASPGVWVGTWIAPFFDRIDSWIEHGK